MSDYKEIFSCRASQSPHLIPVLNLGKQALTGVFPASADTEITTGPLELVWAPESGLLQLRHSYALGEMYGDNYGYRSGLNQSMVQHLTSKVQILEKRYNLQSGDAVLDIGSNDATTLKAYTVPNIKRLGIDPTGAKFKSFYPENIDLVPDFFSAENYWKSYSQPAKIVTSISMFYDLEHPTAFSKQVAEILAEDGVWHLEQSYLPAMLRNNAYDTICHEHLEYYSLYSIQRILQCANLKIIDVTMNNVNGGSFALTVTHAKNTIECNDVYIQWIIEQERDMALHTPKPYREFEDRVFKHRERLQNLIFGLNKSGKKVIGYGASTKGNVLLQFCGFTAQDIPAIADVNPDKYGKYTPGTYIPIISEAEAHAMQPDYLLVLPWHFKEGFLMREKSFLTRGGHLIFPFPEIEII